MSWRKYGGTNNLEQSNNINTINLATDNLTIRNYYVGLFDVSGTLKVSGEVDVSGNLIVQTDSFLYGNLDICGNVTIGNNVFLDGNITILKDSYIGQNSFVSGNSYIGYNTYIGGNVSINKSLDIQNDSIFNGNITVKKNAIIYDKLFLGEQQKFYLYGDPSGYVGINTTQPQAILDIKGDIPKNLYLHSTVIDSYCIPAQNKDYKGLLIGTDGSASFINFFNDTSMNDDSVPSGNLINYYDSQIRYTMDMNGQGGVLIFSSPNTAFSSRFIVNPLGNYFSHINDETLVIYDHNTQGNGFYLPDIYGNTHYKGNGMTLVSPVDTSSITFLHIGTLDGTGISIGGGQFTLDSSYSDTIDNSYNGEIFILGFKDSSQNEIIPSIIGIRNQTINDKNKYTIGVNTFRPKLGNYVMDMNGQIHIANGQINIVSTPFTEIVNMRNDVLKPSTIIAVGSPLYYTNITPEIEEQLYGIHLTDHSYNHIVYYSSDGGNNWWYTNLSDISNCNIGNNGGEGTTESLRGLYIYDNSLSFVGGNNGYIFFTNNGGFTFYHPSARYIDNNNGILDNINSIYLGKKIYNKHNPNDDNNPNSIDSLNRLYLLVDTSYIYHADISYTAFVENNTAYTTIYVNKLDNQDYDYYTNIRGIYDSVNNTETIFFIGHSPSTKDTILITNQDISDPLPSFSLHNIIGYNYNYNDIYTSEEYSIVIAYGNNIISYSTDSINSWNIWHDISVEDRNLTSCVMRDSSTVFFTTSSGEIFYTNDLFKTQLNNGSFLNIPNEILNSGGNGHWLGTGNYSNILLSNDSTFIISNILQEYDGNTNAGISSIIAGHFPYLLNRFNDPVLDICGTVVISGDLKVMDDGKIYTENHSIDLFNENVSTIRFGGDATEIIMGNSIVGNTRINTNVNIMMDTSLNGNLSVDGNTYLHKNLLMDSAGYIQTTKITGNPSPQGYTDASYLLIIGDHGVDNYLYGNTRIVGNISYVEESSSKFPSKNLYLNYPPLQQSSVGGGMIILDYNGNGDKSSSILLDASKSGFIINVPMVNSSVDLNVGGIQTHGLVVSRLSTELGMTDSSYTLISQREIDCSFSIVDTTPSINYNTGALRVVGGVGIKGNLSVDGLIYSQYDISVNGNLISGKKLESLTFLNSVGKSLFNDSSFQTWVDVSNMNMHHQLNLNGHVNQYIYNNLYNDYTNLQIRVGDDQLSLEGKGFGNLYAIGKYIFSNIANNGNNGSLSYYNNIGFGSNILGMNVSGNCNTGIGFDIMNSVTYGSNNIAIGTSILNENTIGHDNTAIGGMNVLKDNITGSYNTAIGSLSGNNNTSGSYNTYLGYNTSSSNYSYSCAVGANSKNTKDHEIMLGTSSETVYMPSIFRQW